MSYSTDANIDTDATETNSAPPVEVESGDSNTEDMGTVGSFVVNSGTSTHQYQPSEAPSPVLTGEGGDEIQTLQGFITKGGITGNTTPLRLPPGGIVEGAGTAYRIDLNGLFHGTAEGETPDARFQDEFGVIANYDHATEVDPDVEWPFTIIQSLMIQVTDPSLIAGLDAITISAECGDIETTIESIEVLGAGWIQINLSITYNCPGEVGSDNTVNSTTTVGGETTEADVGVVGQAHKPPESPGGVTHSTSSGGFGNPGSFTHPVARNMGVGGACVPADSPNVNIPVRGILENAAADEYLCRITFDSSVINVVDVVAGNTFPAPTITTLNNTEGVVEFTATDAQTHSLYSLLDWDSLNRTLAELVVDPVGANGDTTALNIRASSFFKNGGDEIDRVGFGSGTIDLRAGLRSESVAVTAEERAAGDVSVRASPQVASYTINLNYNPATATPVSVTGGDLPVDSWNASDGTLTVSGDGAAVGDPTLFAVTWEGVVPDQASAGSYKRSFPLTFQAGSEVRDANGDVITTACNTEGSFSLEANIEADPDDNEIPEVGVVYWPLVFPFNFTLTNVKTDLLTEDDIRIVSNSQTNPSIYHVRESYTERPDDNEVDIELTIVIPKADPQNYPVRFDLGIYIGVRVFVSLGLIIGDGATFNLSTAGDIAATIGIRESSGFGPPNFII